MYDDVLLPVDENTAAGGLLHHAGEIAHYLDASITLLHVADTSRDSVTVVEADVVDALVQEGRDVVAEAGETLDTLGVDYETDVVQGDPAATIVEYADEYGFDLVAMPTTGRRGLSRYLLGSVTEKVVRLSPVPVLTARVDPDDQLTFPYERVLVPTDGSDGAARGVAHGLDLAAALDATLHVVSVVDDAALGFDVRSIATESEAAAVEAVEAVSAEAESRGVTAVEHVEHGTPDEEILACVESNDLHAVVMGTTGRRGIDRVLLGSVAEKTVRSAPVPVVTVGE